MKPLRSVLYTPGHRPRMVHGAARHGADAVCLVLEDSVPRDERPAARELVRSAIPELVAAGQTVLAKVNALEGGALEEDVTAITQPGLSAIVCPKVATPDDVRRIDEIVARHEAASGADPGSIELVLLIETPLAVVQAYALAAAVPRVGSVMVGSAANGDLAGALGLVWSEAGTERLYVMSKVLVDARAAGIHTPFDGVWTGIGDIDGLRREARLARSLGYRGKFAVHPEQVGPINEEFTPSRKELESARRVVSAFDEALARGSAATVVDGRFVDYAMVDTARRLLELAATIPGVVADRATESGRGREADRATEGTADA